MNPYTSLLRHQSANIYFVLWALAAVLLRDTVPALFWATVTLLPLTALALSERQWLTSPTARKICWFTAVLLVLHVGLSLVRTHYYNAALPGTYWADDHEYYNQAKALASAWQERAYPEFWRKGPPPYIGTLHTGYHRPLATVFLLFGPSSLAGLLLNAVSLSLMPMTVALLARYLFPSEAENENSTSAISIRIPFFNGKFNRNDTPLIAAALTALHPNQFYWAAYLMKDSWTSLVFAVTTAVILGAIQRKSIPLLLAALLLLPYLFTVRIYACASVVMGLLFLPGLLVKTPIFLRTLLGAALVLFLLFSYTEHGNLLFGQMESSLAAVAPKHVNSATGILKQLAAGIPRLFMAPYAWVILPNPTPMYGLYPGMWYLYLIAYPFGFAGFYAVLRRNIRLAVIPISALVLAGLILLTAEYGGTAPRQRFYLEYIILIFAAYGIKYPNKWWIGGIYGAETAWIIGQMIAMKS